VAAALGTADTPRAHLVNPFGIGKAKSYYRPQVLLLTELPECLRELGLEDEAMRMATTDDTFKAFRWVDNLTSPEYGRVACWGSATSQLVYHHSWRILRIACANYHVLLE
jgi:hypothetical protein